MTRSAVQCVALFAQAHLDERLPLARLAHAANMSPHHFHRVFKEESGETPAAFVRRLRLEQAAFRLLLHEESILEIALDCGFKNHETLTRNFRRHFGRSPRDYRRRQRFALASRHRRATDRLAGSTYRLSPTRVRTLKARAVAFKRSIGPYEDVDPNLWRELEAWADDKGLPRERLLIGIGHDAPGITTADRLRFDACITVPEGTTPGRGIRIGELPPLLCAVTTHVGPYGSLSEAYSEVFARASRLDRYALIGLPAIEVYRDPEVDTLRAVSCTDIHLPVKGPLAERRV